MSKQHGVSVLTRQRDLLRRAGPDLTLRLPRPVLHRRLWNVPSTVGRQDGPDCLEGYQEADGHP